MKVPKIYIFDLDIEGAVPNIAFLPLKEFKWPILPVPERPKKGRFVGLRFGSIIIAFSWS